MSAGNRVRIVWKTARIWIVFALGLAGTITAISIPIFQNDLSIGLQVDDVAPFDILAPYALSYTSDILTASSQQDAELAVPVQYNPPDRQVARQQVEKLGNTLEFIDLVRSDELATVEEKIGDLTSLDDVQLTMTEAAAILELPQAWWETVKLESTAVLEQVMRSEIREDRLADFRRSVPALVSIALPSEQSDLVATLVTAYVAPNTTINEEATEAARAAARHGVAPQTNSYAAGETIIERGEVADLLHLEALEAFGLLKPQEPWKEIVVNILLVGLLGSILALYAITQHRPQVENFRILATLSALFVLVTLAMQAWIPGRTVLPYLFPAATLPILISILISPGMGVLTALVTGTLAGHLAPNGLEMTLYFALSGAMASLVIGRAERMTAFLRTGLAASAAAVVVVAIFRSLDPTIDIVGKATLAAAGLGSGVLSAMLALGLLLPLGNLLGVVTSLQLIEFSRPDHPLLQFILKNAPGTYQHSLQVANLAEQAARAVGANPLLTRVGALYHDAGKAMRPEFFIENQVSGQNTHAQLDPTTSASVILAHVQDGLELARKHRLPPVIQSFITEHHGDMRTSYQYREALEAAGGDESAVDELDFTYPGPSPNSRETALLMLADGVEAKARADSPATEEDIDRLVRNLIRSRLESGQLDKTDLTLRDLDKVRHSFVRTLKGIYHPRLRYPETSSQASERIEEAQRSTGSQTSS